MGRVKLRKKRTWLAIIFLCILQTSAQVNGSVTASPPLAGPDFVFKQGEIESSALSLEEAEKRLVFDKYLNTSNAAWWAVSQKESIIPILETMFTKYEYYKKQGHGVTGAFPFNALFALAHINSPQALGVLEKYYTNSQDDTARLAIAGYQLRRKTENPNYGVLIFDSAKLYKEPNMTAAVLDNLVKGQPIKVLKQRVENPNETNGRGGMQTYDYVEMIPTGIRGYIGRKGDDFLPFM